MDSKTTDNSFYRYMDLKKNTISANTKRSYFYFFVKLYREGSWSKDYGVSGHEDLSWLQDHMEEVMEISIRTLALSTVRSRTSIFKDASKLLGFKDAYLYYSIEHVNLKKDLADVTKKQKRTAVQEKYKIDYNEYVDWMNEVTIIAIRLTNLPPHLIKFKDYEVIQEAFVLQLMYQNPLRRDIGDCRWYRDCVKASLGVPTNHKCNCVFRDDNQNYWLSLKDFKNQSTIGDQMFQLNDTCKYFLSHMMESDWNQTNSLLINKKKGRMTRDTFGRNCFKEYIKHLKSGKASRINDWRSAIVSWTFKGDTSMALRMDLAQAMCHSVRTQQQHYEKKD
jgi:hypothetical protein